MNVLDDKVSMILEELASDSAIREIRPDLSQAASEVLIDNRLAIELRADAMLKKARAAGHA